MAKRQITSDIGPDDRLQLSRVRRAVNKLHRWYYEYARAMPWRETRDPYSIWVSEAMLQQTQVATVVPYYEKWLRAFPNVSTLAAATESDVLKLWEGLGYYSRARNLFRAARRLDAEHGGQIPRDPEAFSSLPGVGSYTTAAVMSIAFDLDLAVVDGNVVRVLCRVFAIDGVVTTARVKRLLQDLAQALLRPGSAATHNQAMMELGALVCTPRRPRCAECPLARVCKVRQFGMEATNYPRKPKRKRVPHHELAVGVVYDAKGKVLLYQRPYGGLLAGLWDLPHVKIDGSQAEPSLLRCYLREHFGITVRVGKPLPEVKHAYSHFKVTLRPRSCNLRTSHRIAEGQQRVWVAADELDAYPLPRAIQKVLRGS